MKKVSRSDTKCLFNKSKAIYIQHKNLLQVYKGNIKERVESGTANKQVAGRDASIRRFWKNQRIVGEMG